MSHYPESLPLFPLNTVLFPGGRLKLRIFEPRYTDLISRSMRHGGGFGICPIDRGSELEPTSICPVGTLATIVDFETLEDGLLGIVVQGDRRFDIGEQWRGEDQLLHAEVEWLPTPGDFAVKDRWQGLVSLLEQLWPEMQREYGYGPWPEEVGSYWLMGRLAEVLPAEPGQRTELLACDDPEEGLELIADLVTALDESEGAREANQ